MAGVSYAPLLSAFLVHAMLQHLINCCIIVIINIIIWILLSIHNKQFKWSKFHFLCNTNLYDADDDIREGISSKFHCYFTKSRAHLIAQMEVECMM